MKSSLDCKLCFEQLSLTLKYMYKLKLYQREAGKDRSVAVKTSFTWKRMDDAAERIMRLGKRQLVE